MPTDMPDKLHLGCGLVTPPGWLNVDGSWNARLNKIPGARALLGALGVLGKRERAAPWSPSVYCANLNKPLPWPDATFSAVYCSHTLEHMYLTKGQELLLECRRVLKPGGVARFVVPDLKAIVQEYLGGPRLDHCFPPSPEDAPPADRMCDRMLFHERFPLKGSILWRMYSAAFGFHWHKWMYDAESLAFHMRGAGFADVLAHPVFDSRIAGIEGIERRERVADGAGIAVEGVRS